MSDKQTQSPQRRRRGMTLIEIMVVITILGLIMAAVGVAVLPQLDKARRDTARLDMHTIQQALKIYYARTSRYPDSGTGLRVLVETQALDKLPLDPWGHEYVYLKEGGQPVIISYGADGTQGGEGTDADLSSRDTETATR